MYPGVRETVTRHAPRASDVSLMSHDTETRVRFDVPVPVSDAHRPERRSAGGEASSSTVTTVRWRPNGPCTHTVLPTTLPAVFRLSSRTSKRGLNFQWFS